MKRVLIVSPHFPPVNTPDLHRVRMLLPWLREAGWEATVLAGEPDATQNLEPELEHTVPKEVRVIRVRPLSLGTTRRFGLRNHGWRLLPALYREGSKLLAPEHWDAVYFSTTQFIVLPLGRFWNRRFGVPYVVDLQDPWRNDFYRRTGTPPPGGWKFSLAWALAAVLEAWTLRKAGHVISVSPDYLEELRRRYDWFKDTPCSTIPFGAAASDFAQARSLPSQTGETAVIYLGRLGPDMEDALDSLFQSVRAMGPQPLKFFFWGTSYSDSTVCQAKEAARTHGLGDIVQEETHRIGYLDGLKKLTQADAILLLGSNDRAYSPSKIHPALLSGRPILAFLHRDSELQRFLADIGLPRTFLIDAEPQQNATLLEEFAAHPENFVLPAERLETFVQRYESRALAARQIEILDQLAGKK